MAESFRSMQTSNSIVSLKDVDFSYAPGERTILSGLNMEFPRGKVIAVMGGSGCGKNLTEELKSYFGTEPGEYLLSDGYKEISRRDRGARVS